MEFRDNRDKFSFPGSALNRRSKSGTVLEVLGQLAPMGQATIPINISDSVPMFQTSRNPYNFMIQQLYGQSGCYRVSCSGSACIGVM